MENNKFANIKQLLNKYPVIVYGAGSIGVDVAKVLLKNNVNFLGFVDKKFTGKKLNFTIENLSSDKIPECVQLEAVIIIGIFNRDVNCLEIVEILKKQGFKNVYTYLEFHAIFAEEIGDKYWLTTLDFYKNKDVLKYKDMFADDKSKQIYKAFIDMRLTANLAEHPFCDAVDLEYFPIDIPSITNDDYKNFVDVGSYNGNTVQQLLEKKSPFVKKIACFEPDLNNYKECVNNIKVFNKEIYTWPCGVWSSSQLLKFSDGSGEASNISESGNITIQTVSLDNALHKFNPTFIKYDVEGAENEALNGTKNIIINNKPILAISVYHSPSHLWELMNQIHDLKLNYKFYLRSYAYNGFDIVLYAVNK